MNQAKVDVIMVEDKFPVAQVALYVFSVLQIVVALATAMGGVPLGIAAEDTAVRRVSTIANAVIIILCFAAGYILLARCLNRCTRLVWRIALSVFLVNIGAAALAIAAQPSNLLQILIFSLAVAGAISVWRGRGVVNEYEAYNSAT
jgi:hypothetical protein